MASLPTELNVAILMMVAGPGAEPEQRDPENDFMYKFERWQRERPGEMVEVSSHTWKSIATVRGFPFPSIWWCWWRR